MKQLLLATAIALGAALPAQAQMAPSAAEVAAYQGLHAAAHAGNLAALRQLIAAKPDLNARDANGRTPLHVATFQRHREGIALLVSAGASMHLLDNDRYDAVTIASVANDPDTLRLLLSLGASAAQITSRYDGTALIESIVLGDGGSRHQATLQALVQAGADLQLTDREGQSPLALAKRLGHTAMVQMLKKAGAR